MKIIPFTILTMFCLTGWALEKEMTPLQKTIKQQNQEKQATASKRRGIQIDQGKTALKAGNYKDALKAFDTLTKENPQNGAAWLLHGYTLNRMKKFRRASESLGKAYMFRVKSPEVALEIGRSYTETGQFEKAIRNLSLYDSQVKDKAETAHLLGRAYFGQKKLAKAKESFEVAIQRDKAFADVSGIYLAAIAQRQGDSAAMDLQINRIIENDPNSRLAKQLQQRLNAATQTKVSPWNFAISGGVAYNSNVIALGDGLPLPTGLSRKDDYLTTYSFDATYDHRLGMNDLLTFGYTVSGSFYNSALDSYDALDQYLYMVHSHMFSQTLSLRTALSHQHSRISDSRFQDDSSLRSSVIWRHHDNYVGVLTASISDTNYHMTSGIPAADRDADRWTIGWTEYMQIPNSPLNVHIGFEFTQNDADGDDYEYGGSRLFAGLKYPLPYNIALDATISRTSNDYDNLNSNTGLTSKRNDDIGSVSIYLSKPLNESMTGYFRYNYTDDDSDIAVFDYSQNRYEMGVTYSF